MYRGWRRNASPSVAAEGSIPDRYWRLNRIWGVFGVLATLLPLADVYFMVAKPR